MIANATETLNAEEEIISFAILYYYHANNLTHLKKRTSKVKDIFKFVTIQKSKQ